MTALKQTIENYLSYGATTQIYTYVTVEKQRQILTVKHPRNRIAVKT